MDFGAFRYWLNCILSRHWKSVILIITILAGGGGIATLLLLRDPFDDSLPFGRHLLTHRHRYNHAAFPTNNVAVVVKTGATVAFSGGLAALLDTSLIAVDDPLIVSDLEQDIGQHHIYDALAAFSEDMKDHQDDFELYRKQQEYVATGNAQGLASLSEMPMTRNLGAEKDKNAAWALDRYKFPRMVELAISERPDRDWYVFIEDDTYLSYNNLIELLARYDPSERWFIGSPVRMPAINNETKPFFFGYGGSGFILSRAVIKDWEVHHYDLASHWDHEISKMWYGDYIFALVLEDELGLRLTSAWPMLNNDEPAMIPFGKETWCQPVVTLHHMAPYLLDIVYQAEKELQGDGLRFRDVFVAANPSGLPSKRDNWTNVADKRDRHEMTKEIDRHRDSRLHPPENAHESFESCKRACAERKWCLMFSFLLDSPLPDLKDKAYVESECYLSDIFRLGHDFEPRQVEYEDESTNSTLLYDRQWTSGWMTDRIDQFIEKHQACGRW